MIRQSVRRVLIAATLAIAGSACATTQADAPAFQEEHNMALMGAIDAPTRTAANRLRDRYRHPYETLSFFGVRPNDTVVEIWPGGGWYTEILAPYILQGGGTYYAAANGNGLNGARSKMTENPSLYGGIRLASFPAGREGATEPKVPDGSADVVLTFRNVHNWMMGETPFAEEAFRQMYAMLKPGGTLGVVDHRLAESADSARERTSGYLKVSTVRRLAEAAGFRLAAESEINANPNDTTDHPRGVWTLPPSLRLGDQDRERYLAIGESDRMTLRFVKPR
jgi:predicted methyltransferase